jgi:hypothetical protein
MSANTKAIDAVRKSSASGLSAHLRDEPGLLEALAEIGTEVQVHVCSDTSKFRYFEGPEESWRVCVFVPPAPTRHLYGRFSNG